jgi:hypothetical protein
MHFSILHLFSSASIERQAHLLQYTPVHIYDQSVRSSISIAHQCPCMITLGFKVSREISLFHVSCMFPYLKYILSRSSMLQSLLQPQERGNLAVARDGGTKPCAASAKIDAYVALHLFARLVLCISILFVSPISGTLFISLLSA